MIHYFAAEAASNPGLLQALGIDAKLLVEQAIAFLILVAVLGKFVYPALVKAIDQRRETIEAGLKQAAESHQALEKAEAKADDLLVQARKDAEDLLARSHTEAAKQIAEAEGKAKVRAEQIIADARTQLEVEVRKARTMLKKEAVGLVAAATEHVLQEKVDVRKDAQLIEKSLARETA